MDLLYASRLCSESRLAVLLREQPVKPALQEQKFHGLLARGLAATTGPVTCLSLLPHRPGTRGLPMVERESEGGLDHRYLSLRMIPGLSHALVFLWSLAATLRWRLSRKAGPCVVLCDVLDLSISAGARVAAALTRTPALAIVTDVPDILHEYIGGGGSAPGRLIIRAYRALATGLMERYDAFLVLTEAMNPVVNPRGRPHVVIEGMVDPAMAAVDNALPGKHPEGVVLYAGALYAKYGVRTLVEAFGRIPDPGARLWLFGSGELEGEIREAQARDARIAFWGVRPNAEVVAAEVRATLLVNPRPSTEAFTRFSFPSKNMEYMASGTPLLTTRLPGMPPEYLEHVFTFEEESAEGMARAMASLLARPREELHARGHGAKAFVLSAKTGPHQAERLRLLLQGLERGA